MKTEAERLIERPSTCRCTDRGRAAISGMFGAGQVVAVLDESWKAERLHRSGTLRVNWLKRRTLFDFDRVEIIQASDYEVERFAVAVGNDTDEFRCARYGKMPCRVARGCDLSENTLKVLRGMFGEVTAEA